MNRLETMPKRLLGPVFGAVVAYAVSLALSGAYRDGRIIDVLLSLALPPLVLFFVYEGSDKRAVFCLLSLFLSAILFDASPLLGVNRAGVNLVLTTIGAMALPVAMDLLFIDMGKRLRVDRLSGRLTGLAFALMVLPLAAWMLLNAHRTILSEDAELIDELAARMTSDTDGNSLVMDRLSEKLRDQAQRRVAIRSSGKTYQLSDADVESVREVRTIRKERNARGAAAETHVTKEQEDRMRLILRLQGTGLPDDVVIYSHRGPLTITEVTVPLQRPLTSEDSPG
jgi:hypothetical protein